MGDFTVLIAIAVICGVWACVWAIFKFIDALIALLSVKKEKSDD